MTLERTESMVNAIRMMADSGYTLTDASFSWTHPTEELTTPTPDGTANPDEGTLGRTVDGSSPAEAAERSQEDGPGVAPSDPLELRKNTPTPREPTEDDYEALWNRQESEHATPENPPTLWAQVSEAQRRYWRPILDATVAVAQERGLVPPMRSLPDWVTPERYTQERHVAPAWVVLYADRKDLDAVNRVLAAGPEGGGDDE